MEKKKLSKLQIFLIIFIFCVVLLLAGAFTAISIASYKPTVAIYNVSEKVQAVLEKELNAMPQKKSGKNRGYNFIVLDTSIPLSAQKKSLKKAKMIFATLDCDVKEFATTNKKVRPQGTKLLEGMPTTTKQTALANGDKLFAVPLLYDFYEFDVNRIAFDESNVKNISVWDDLEAFFSDTLSENSPFVFAAKNDSELIDFVGCVTEALEGTEKLDAVRETLYSAAKKGDLKNLENVIVELCDEGQPLYSVMERISSLRKEKYLNISFADFQSVDKIFFLENHLVNTTFLKLSEHRTIDPNIINEFSSIYIPGKDHAVSRTFSAPTIVGISLSKNDYVTESLLLLATSRQSNLCYNTGLAPVQANCGVPDRQADDVRYWLAASSGPNMPLSTALPSDEMRSIVAEYIRNKMRY